MESQFFQLVEIIDAEPMTSSFVIAKGMQAQHASTIKLVRKYQERLARFGRVRFEIRSFPTRGGMQDREIALLNERQAGFLISLMRNSDAVLGFKENLIYEFFRMRDALQQREQGLWQQMQALIAREVESKVRASFGSHLMLTRKREIPGFRTEHDRLAAEIQPALPLMH